MNRTSKIGLMIILGMVLAVGLHAQGPRQGMIRTQGSLGVSKDFHRGESRYYIWGDAEYMLTDHIGLDGAMLLQVGSSEMEFPEVPLGGQERDIDLSTHFTFFGPNWHFRPDQPLDVFVGFQPGWAFASVPAHADAQLGNRPSAILFGPAASVHGGVAFYGSIFHLFADVRLMGGNAQNENYESRVAQVMGSFGLGFNINTRKRPH